MWVQCEWICRTCIISMENHWTLVARRDFHGYLLDSAKFTEKTAIFQKDTCFSWNKFLLWSESHLLYNRINVTVWEERLRRRVFWVLLELEEEETEYLWLFDVCFFVYSLFAYYSIWSENRTETWIQTLLTSQTSAVPNWAPNGTVRTTKSLSPSTTSL